MVEGHTIETYGRPTSIWFWRMTHNIWPHTIETYGRGPHNRNIWPHTIARRRRRRHAWPILLFAVAPAFYPLLPWNDLPFELRSFWMAHSSNQFCEAHLLWT